MNPISASGLASSIINLADAAAKLSVKLFTTSRQIDDSAGLYESTGNEISVVNAVLSQLGALLSDKSRQHIFKQTALDSIADSTSQCNTIFTHLQTDLTPAGTKDGSAAQVLAEWKDKLTSPSIQKATEVKRSTLRRLHMSLTFSLNVALLGLQAESQDESVESKALLIDQGDIVRTLWRIMQYNATPPVQTPQKEVPPPPSSSQALDLLVEFSAILDKLKSEVSGELSGYEQVTKRGIAISDEDLSELKSIVHIAGPNQLVRVKAPHKNVLILKAQLEDHLAHASSRLENCFQKSIVRIEKRSKEFIDDEAANKHNATVDDAIDTTVAHNNIADMPTAGRDSILTGPSGIHDKGVLCDGSMKDSDTDSTAESQGPSLFESIKSDRLGFQAHASLVHRLLNSIEEHRGKISRKIETDMYYGTLALHRAFWMRKGLQYCHEKLLPGIKEFADVYDYWQEEMDGMPAPLVALQIRMLNVGDRSPSASDHNPATTERARRSRRGTDSGLEVIVERKTSDYQYASAPAKARPTWIKVHTKYLLAETLDAYKLPWEFDPLDSSYFLIKEYISHELQKELFDHTRQILAERAQSNKVTFATEEKIEKKTAIAQDEADPSTDVINNESTKDEDASVEQEPSRENTGELLDRFTNIDEASMTYLKSVIEEDVGSQKLSWIELLRRNGFQLEA